MFVYHSYFVLLYFFFCPFSCMLFFLDIRILIIPLLSSNSLLMSTLGEALHSFTNLHFRQV